MNPLIFSSIKNYSLCGYIVEMQIRGMSNQSIQLVPSIGFRGTNKRMNIVCKPKSCALTNKNGR